MNQRSDKRQFQPCLFNAEVFKVVNDYIRIFCRQMIDEIKCHVKITEQI